MRVLRLFLVSLILVGGLGALTFLTGREILLTWGTFSLKQGITDLANAGSAPGTYETECADKFNLSIKTAAKLNSIEIAFTDDTHFHLQVVCAAYAFEPMVVKEYQLPPFVTKVPGSAGYVFSRTYPTSVTLQLWGRSETVILNNNDTQVVQGTAPVTSNITPQAACHGYGFQCCQEGASVGTGDQAFGATDCPKTCYSQCAVRPVVLSLNTEPFYNPQNRELVIANGNQVTFSFTSNLTNAQVKSTILSYGDGQSDTIASGSGLLSHTYRCATSPCQYEAKLSITDRNDVSNADTAVNKVLVKVQ